MEAADGLPPTLAVIISPSLPHHPPSAYEADGPVAGRPATAFGWCKRSTSRRVCEGQIVCVSVMGNTALDFKSTLSKHLCEVVVDAPCTCGLVVVCFVGIPCSCVWIASCVGYGVSSACHMPFRAWFDRVIMHGLTIFFDRDTQLCGSPVHLCG